MENEETRCPLFPRWSKGTLPILLEFHIVKSLKKFTTFYRFLPVLRFAEFSVSSFTYLMYAFYYWGLLFSHGVI